MPESTSLAVRLSAPDLYRQYVAVRPWVLTLLVSVSVASMAVYAAASVAGVDHEQTIVAWVGLTVGVIATGSKVVRDLWNHGSPLDCSYEVPAEGLGVEGRGDRWLVPHHDSDVPLDEFVTVGEIEERRGAFVFTVNQFVRVPPRADGKVHLHVRVPEPQPEYELTRTVFSIPRRDADGPDAGQLRQYLVQRSGHGLGVQTQKRRNARRATVLIFLGLAVWAWIQAAVLPT